MFFWNFVFAAENSINGIQLCDNMFSFLKKNKINPQAQYLLSSGENSFPYNILISNSIEDSEENLVLAFKMEQAFENQQLILDTITTLNFSNVSYTILLSYGENNLQLTDNIICGSQVFIESLNTNKKSNVFIFDLNTRGNEFITGSHGITSPAWMIYAVFSAYVQERITDDLSFYYLSQFSKYKFYQNSFLSDFHLSGIPAIKLNFNTQNSGNKITTEKVTRIVEDVIKNYKNISHETNDYHSLMIRFFNKTIWFSEYTIVKIIIILIFFFIFAIYFIGYINSNLKVKAWTQLKNNWHTIPITLLLTVIGFFAGKYVYIFVNKFFSFTHTPYGIVILEILISSVFVSAFYLYEMAKNKQFGEKSVDFLIFISTFINLFIFSIIDISLFPFFLSITILSILSLIVRKNWTHIILEIITIVTFAPYVFHLYNFAPSDELRNFLINKNLVCILLPLIIQPVYILLLRIFTATRKRFQKTRVFVLIISLTYFFFLVLLTVSNHYLFTPKNLTNKEIEIKKIDSENHSITYSDKKVFGDVVRTLNITTGKDPVYVELLINGVNKTPILYSDNEFINYNKNTSCFLIPYYPPEKMVFSYGASTEECEVILKAYYQTEKQNSFYLIQETLHIEAK